MLLSLLPDAPLGCASTVILSLYCATSVLNTAVPLLLLALYPLLCSPFCPARQRPLHTFPASLFCPAYLFTPTSFFICSSASFLSSQRDKWIIYLFLESYLKCSICSFLFLGEEVSLSMPFTGHILNIFIALQCINVSITVSMRFTLSDVEACSERCCK